MANNGLRVIDAYRNIREGLAGRAGLSVAASRVSARKALESEAVQMAMTGSDPVQISAAVGLSESAVIQVIEVREARINAVIAIPRTVPSL